MITSRLTYWEEFKKIFLGLSLCIAVLVGIREVYKVFVYVSKQKFSCPRCDVIILDIDVLRADALRCGADTITPNLCKLIRKGTNFTNAYSQSYWTLPSSLSTYTSLYPNRNQVWDVQSKGAIASSSATLATFLQQRGYTTQYAGLSAEGLLSEENGGLRGYTNVQLAPRKDLFWKDIYKSATNTKRPIFFHAYASWPHMPYFLDPGQQPLVSMAMPQGFPLHEKDFEPVWRSYLISHVYDIFKPETIVNHPEIFLADPSVRTQRIVDFFQLLDDQNDYTQRYYSWDTTSNSYLQFINPNKPQDILFFHMLYETQIHLLDAKISDFVDYLLQPEIAAHTIVVITSSHGEAFGEHGTFGHVSIPYNELYHVPLVIKYPNGVGHVFDGVVENIDIYPTIAEMVTGSLQVKAQGVSLFPILSGVSNQAKSYAISMNENNIFVIQTKRYALLLYKDSRLKPELYDLLLDPTEQHDIASRYPDIVKRYVYLFQQSHAVPELFLPTTVPVIPSTIEKKDLIRSGYF